MTDDLLEAWPTGFIVDSNKGGIPVKLCSCGVMCYGPMARKHAEQCPIFLAEANPEQAQT